MCPQSTVDTQTTLLAHSLCSSGGVLFIVEHGECISMRVAHKLTNDCALKSVEMNIKIASHFGSCFERNINLAQLLHSFFYLFTILW